MMRVLPSLGEMTQYGLDSGILKKQSSQGSGHLSLVTSLFFKNLPKQ